MRDMHSGLKTVLTLEPKPTAETRYGAPVDRRGFGAVEHIVCIGTAGDVLSEAVSIACLLEASDDASNWTPVTAESEVLGDAPDETGIFALIGDESGDQRDYRIGYVGPARYTRVAVVLTGEHVEGTPVSALALLGFAQLKPVE
ncbi:MAG: hypothetical protein AMXMBFR74_17640 [Parvibaculum sp.]|uniref:hypothetical protein n=1 Tax=Parvibaculum sp. TaxID=2024848 RepID=UPI0035B99933